MKEISLLGWVLIGVISLIVLSSYWSLISLIRKKNNQPGAPSWTKSWKALTNPWEKEDKQLGELNRQVSRLQKDNAIDEGANSPGNQGESQ